MFSDGGCFISTSVGLFQNFGKIKSDPQLRQEVRFEHLKIENTGGEPTVLTPKTKVQEGAIFSEVIYCSALTMFGAILTEGNCCILRMVSRPSIKDSN